MKIHETPKGRIVAACDKELIGTVLEEGGRYLDLEKHREFYQGESAEEEELEKELSRFSSANLVGEKAVKVALKLELTGEDAVIYINKTPHIQLYKI